MLRVIWHVFAGIDLFSILLHVLVPRSNSVNRVLNRESGPIPVLICLHSFVNSRREITETQSLSDYAQKNCSLSLFLPEYSI